MKRSAIFLWILLLVGLLTSFVSAYTDYETMWGHPKECGNVDYTQMLPGDCQNMEVSSFGGKCTAQGVRTFCDFLLNVTSYRHVLCNQPDPYCDYMNITLTCPKITVNDFMNKWGFLETERFTSDKQIVEMINKYHPGIFYIDPDQDPRWVDYKAIRKTGTVIIKFVRSASSRTDIDNSLSNIDNKYIDGILFNMEAHTIYGDGWDALWYLNKKTHDAGKLLLVTNPPYTEGYAPILNTYADGIMPFMFYANYGDIRNQLLNWKRLVSVPVMVLAGIGFVGNPQMDPNKPEMNPTAAAGIPSYVKNTLGLGHYLIFAGKTFYTCSQGGACGSQIDTPIPAAYAGSYRTLLENLNNEYGSAGIPCTQSLSRACTSSDWNSTILVQEDCSINKQGILYWKRLNECYGGVEHAIQENTSCSNQNPSPQANNSGDNPTTNPETEAVILSFTLPNDEDQDGVINSLDACPNTINSARVNERGCPLPYWQSFQENSTNLNSVDLKNIESLEIKNSFAAIKFSENVNLVRENAPVTIDNNVVISQNKVSVNSTNIPELNKKALITFYNINYTNPQILRNSAICTECKLVNYSNNILTIEVNGFSTYEIVETTNTTASLCNSSILCGEWSICQNNTKTKNCYDQNNCVANNTVTETCSIVCTPNWQCSSWSNCTTSKATRICQDNNQCGGQYNKPEETLNCTTNNTSQKIKYLIIILCLFVILIVGIFVYLKLFQNNSRTIEQPINN